MKKHRLLFGISMILLVVLVSVLLDVESTDRPDSIRSVKAVDPVTPVFKDNIPGRMNAQRAVRNTSIPVSEVKVDPPRQPSESELLGEDGVNIPQPDYPPKPDIPDYDMPEGPDIMSFEYQRLYFKNMPDDKRMGVALYVKVKAVDQRKYAYLHRTYLSQLTTFLAANYEYEAVKTESGKQTFLDMLKVRFARRLKGDQLAELETAFFEEVDL
ncbi:MAG: hypothetical protein ACPGQS_02050 [Bradymonadia bacterium]